MIRVALCGRLKRCAGWVYVVALAFLMILSVLAIVLAHEAGLELRKAANHRDGDEALMAAEGGLHFMMRCLKETRLPSSTTGETLIDDLTSALGQNLNGTANLNGAAVETVGGATVIPNIALPDGSFQATISMAGADSARLVVVGRHEDAVRKVSLDLNLESSRSEVFDYAVVTRGQLRMSGNAKVIGLNDPSEGSLMSASSTTDDAIIIEGNVTISGDLYAAGDNARALISGSPSIAGTTIPAEWASHVHSGAAEPDFPEVDAGPIIALATNTYDPASSGDVLSNIRIPAGTNPVFTKDTQINGVVYIEAPNIVRFGAKVVLTGILVTEKKAGCPIANCEVAFGGNVDIYGVESLPEDPAYAAVKAFTGTSILAPGFSASFAGNVSAVTGNIAADKLTFLGTASGTIRGTVVGLADYPTSIGGNVEIRVDSLNADPDPAGFRKPVSLVPDNSSYLEVFD